MQLTSMRLVHALVITVALTACDVAGTEPYGSPYGSGAKDTDNSPASPAGDAGADSAFCTDYNTTCGWKGAGRFESKAACLSFEQGASAAVKACTDKHLALAKDDAATHCPHAAGHGPCEEATLFCGAYETACGFDAAGFADAAACSTALGKMADDQKICAEMHVELAKADPKTHCPHARGEGPCAKGAMPVSTEADFCGQYDKTCSFGGTGRFASAADCSAARAGMEEAEKKCTTDHLALAASDPDTHCAHATGTGPCNPATFFCATYEQACTFGTPTGFTSSDACQSGYAAFSPVTRACAEEHVVLAESDPTTHCPHAHGEGPCAAARAFCTLYTTRCGYGGSDRFSDLADCQASISEFAADREACAEEHLILAGGDATLHCPHATGLGPCAAK